MRSHAARSGGAVQLPHGKVVFSVAVLVALIFSKFFYTASMSSYYTFYLDRSVRSAGADGADHAVRVSGLGGGGYRDRRQAGRSFRPQVRDLGVDLRRVAVHASLPYANLFWTGALTVPIGLILASAFPAIVVYGQELMPLKVGTVAGLFFGLAFGLGGTGAALIGQLADATSIQFVFKACSFLPLLGLLAALLPHIETRGGRRAPRGTAVDAAGPLDASGRANG